jgi:hypothetical protein
MAHIFGLEPDFTADSDITADSDVPVDSGGQPYVNLPDLAATDFANRLLRLFPNGWLSDAAQVPGGVAYATFLGIGTPLDYNLAQFQFVAAGLRIKLAYGSALDVISTDYFGNGLPRLPGETDTAFRARILAQLLRPRVTKAAVGAAILAAVGVSPIVCEPWSVGYTLCWDLNGYWSTDSQQNAPARWGDMIPFTGFIDISAPVNMATGGFPVYAYDIGFSWDIPTGAWDLAGFTPTPALEPNFIATVAETVEAYIAMGITVGIRFSSVSAITPNFTAVAAFTASSNLIAQSNPALIFSMQSWLQTFGVWLEVLPWQASAWCPQRGVNFQFTASATASVAGTIGWYASIYTNPQSPALRVGVNAGQSSLTVSMVVASGLVPIITADWNTIPYVTSFGSGTMGISLSAAGPGNLDIAFVAGSTAGVSSGAPDVVISDTFPETYGVFAVPSWQTTMSVSKSPGSFTLTFGTAPSAPGTIYWAVMAV